MRERTLTGAPGVYPAAAGPAGRTLAGVRMDVAAFVGIAPRGPCRLPALQAPWAEPPSGPGAPLRPRRSVAVPVESWDAYRRLFGGFEGPGLLPYAVAAFFEQGGRRCHVVRVVHEYAPDRPEENDRGVAFGPLPGVVVRGAGAPPRLRARDEGSWGNALSASLRLSARPLPVESATAAEVTVPRAAPLPVGTLLRLRLPDGSLAFRFVTATREAWAPDRPAVLRHATLETPLADAPGRVEVVEGEIAASDGGGDGVARDELHERVGLHPEHPRWLAAVLHHDSRLLRPDPAWIDLPLDPADAALRPAAPPDAPQFRCGRDRWAEVEPGDFLDRRWDPRSGVPGDGVHALAEEEEVALVCVPDLYSPGPAEPPHVPEPAPIAGPTFEPCVEMEEGGAEAPADGPCPGGLPASDDGSATGLDGLRLDPVLDRDAVAALQGELVALAERLASWVVLLDVPPGSTPREALEWRAGFGTAWAAAFHPWLRVARPDDARGSLVSVPPSAFAAGIAARREAVFGVPHGPANEVAAGAVAAAERVPEASHAELHRAGINLFVPERDGVRLTAARTLSRDPAWRQLSVRRLVTQLGRTLRRRMRWTAFEPNGPELRDELRRLLETWLRRLFTEGAFRGRTPEESYFVRCDDALNPPASVEAGRLVCHVGVAPAEPLEFIVLRLTREGDGTLLLEE